MTDTLTKALETAHLIGSSEEVPATSRPERLYPWLLAKLTGKQCGAAEHEGRTVLCLRKKSLRRADMPTALAALRQVLGEDFVVERDGDILVMPRGLHAYCEKYGPHVAPQLQSACMSAFDDPAELARLRKQNEEWMAMTQPRQDEPFNPADWDDDADDRWPLLEGDSGTGTGNSFEHLVFQQHVLQQLTGEHWTRIQLPTADGPQEAYRLHLPSTASGERRMQQAMIREIVKKHAVEEGPDLILTAEAVEHYALRAGFHDMLRSLTGKHWKHSNIRNGETIEDGFSPVLSKSDSDNKQPVLDKLKEALLSGVHATPKGIVVTQKALQEYRDVLTLGHALSRLTGGKPWKHILRRNLTGQKRHAFVLDLPDGMALARPAEAAAALKDTLRMDVFDNARGEDRLVVWADAMQEYTRARGGPVVFGDAYGLIPDNDLSQAFRTVRTEMVADDSRRWSGQNRAAAGTGRVA